MPKIIPELRIRFVEAAKYRLLHDQDFTIRQVAQDCNTAVGTVYNYFSSKEALLAEVMMEDWMACCMHMRQDAAAENTPVEAIRQTSAALRRFSERYAPLWRNYAAARDSMDALTVRHRQIIGDITGAVAQTLERFSITGNAYLPEILAELILYASRTEEGFERIVGILEKILV